MYQIISYIRILLTAKPATSVRVSLSYLRYKLRSVG